MFSLNFAPINVEISTELDLDYQTLTFKSILDNIKLPAHPAGQYRLTLRIAGFIVCDGEFTSTEAALWVQVGQHNHPLTLTVDPTQVSHYFYHDVPFQLQISLFNFVKLEGNELPYGIIIEGISLEKWSR